jgi:peptidoglycan/xylan/chitin deacetylase (PgdA/CDA1 family)
MITFDEGAAAFARHVSPLLERFGLQGVCFVSPADCGDARTAAELVARGTELGVRPAADVPLTTLEPDRIIAEALGARASVEEAIGLPARAWAYPGGDQDEIARRAIGAAGFELGFTLRAERARWQHPLLALPRIAVPPDEDLAGFIARLAGNHAYY